MSGPRDAYQYINSTGQVSVSNTATEIIAANTQRGAVLITNTSTSVAVYLGTSTVTSSTGHQLPAGASTTIPVYCAIYAITSSSTATCTWLEVQ